MVFDLSLAIGLYALTNYMGIVMGTRRRGISRSLLDVSGLAARAGLDWKPALVLGEARSAYRPPSQRAGVHWAMGPDPRVLRV